MKNSPYPVHVNFVKSRELNEESVTFSAVVNFVRTTGPNELKSKKN
jgi:hypothetical protein